MSKIKLFCFPYAGGSSTAYIQWKKQLDPAIVFRPFELKGRGRRMSEPLSQSMEDLVEDIYSQIKHEVDDTPYALFGHSMGSLTVYELSQTLRRRNHQNPEVIFCSGRRPPTYKPDRYRSHLSEEEFKQELITMGGTPKEVLEHKELLEFFLPMLRADFKVVETYDHNPSNERLDVPMFVLNGLQDEMTNIAYMGEWQNHTTGDFTLKNYEGGHFFLHDHTESIVQLVNQQLLQALQRKTLI